MEKKIRFSEVQLDSDQGNRLKSIAKKGLKLSEADIRKAVMACDVYEPFTSKSRKNIEGPASEGYETVDEDLFDSAVDYTEGDRASSVLNKDMRNAEVHTYATGLLQSAPNLKKDCWDMYTALTTGEKVKISTTDPNYQSVGTQNEIILLNTYIYLMGKGPEPAVLARPAFENNGELVVSDEPMSLDDIKVYLLIQFSYNIQQGMYDFIRPNVKGENPSQDRKRRIWAITKQLGIDAEDLNLTWFYTLGLAFLTEGFWEVVSNFSNLRRTSDKPLNGMLDVNKGILLDTTTQEYLSGAREFDMDFYDDSVTCLMNWVAHQIKLRFDYYRKEVNYNIAKGITTKVVSSDELQDQIDDKSGSSKLEREMFRSGAYTDSPEDEIAINQSLDAFFKKEKYWLTDIVDNFNDTFPILRYIAAMIEYPCCSGVTILNAVGFGHIQRGSKHVNNWAALFTNDRPPAKGSMGQLSIEVSRKLKKYGLLELFMGLINHFGGYTYRTKILNELKKVYDEFDGTPEETATIPLTFRPHSEEEIRAIQAKGKGYWYLVDNLFVQRSLDKWHNYCKPLEGTENENLIELGENMIMDACDWNMDAIVPTFYYDPTKSILRQHPELMELLNVTSKKIEDEEEERHKKNLADLEAQETDKALKNAGLSRRDSKEAEEEDTINESVFKDIYKKTMKNKLFEKIHANAKK